MLRRRDDRDEVGFHTNSHQVLSRVVRMVVVALVLLLSLLRCHTVTSFQPHLVVSSSHHSLAGRRMSITLAVDSGGKDGTVNETPSFSDLDTLKIGQWEEMHGNFLLRPALESGPPRALVHFLGGAIVGASPHLSYRYLLERLASEGYLIVATPYELSFDHLATCDQVIYRFERIAGQIARTYGALPVVGVGHSCGALLQVLITSLFPDTPRAANALLSFNNKPVSEAVPLFEEVFVPFFTYAAALNETSRPRGSQVIRTSLQLAQYSARGQLPPDELLTKALQVFSPPILADKAPSIAVPLPIRDAYRQFTAPSTSILTNAELVPLVVEALKALEQIPLLIDEVALGARDFVPPPAQVRQAARRAYRARRTLVIRYTNDPIDESEELEEILQAAQQIASMKRPLMPDAFRVQRCNLEGGHASPVLAPPLDLAVRAQDILGPDAAQEAFRYAEAENTVKELVRWLEEANL